MERDEILVMIIHTILKICNQQGTTIRSYKTKRFTGATHMEIIGAFISKKYANASPPFDIRIVDQFNGPVTLDQDYLDEYNPFGGGNLNLNTVQTINSLETTVILYVFLPDHILGLILDQHNLAILTEALEMPAELSEQIEQINDVMSISEPPKHPIRLSEDPKMGFVEGHNVNGEPRDQYWSDAVNVDSGEITGTLVMLQGEKNLTNKYRKVLPRFKIWNDDVRNGSNHVWTLLVYIVFDVYESGKRSLFIHPERIFVKNVNATEYSNPYEIPITTTDWFNDEGAELQLTTVVIEGAKKHSNAPLYLMCELQRIGESASADYIKSRLALVLCKDAIIQWETLVLSNEMIFKGKVPKTGIMNILNVPANATPKRRRPKKNQTTPTERSKRSKGKRVEDHSTSTNLTTFNGDFAPLLSLGDDRIETSTTQTMSNIPASQIVLDSADIEIFTGDPTDVTTILNYFPLSDVMDMGDSVLIADDPLLSLPWFSDSHSPNS